MTEVVKANVERHSMGDLVIVTADLSDVGDSETYNVPHISRILGWNFHPQTDDSCGGTVSANVITFKNGTTQAGKCTVWGK